MTDEAASLRALAKQYGVSPTTIAKMVRKAQQDFEQQQSKMIMGRDGKDGPTGAMSPRPEMPGSSGYAMTDIRYARSPAR